MKRTPLTRKTPLARTGAPLTRKQPRPALPDTEGFSWLLSASTPLVLARSGGICEYTEPYAKRRGRPITAGDCGNPTGPLHHRHPRKMGGSRDPMIHSPANLLALCWQHHEYVEGHREEARRRGLLVPWNEPPHEFAVELRYGRIWLTLAGGWTRINPRKLSPGISLVD